MLCAASFLLASYYVLGIQFESYMFLENGWVRVGLVTGSILLGLHFVDLYNQIRIRSHGRLLQDLCQVMGVTLIAQGLISYGAPDLRLGRGIMLVGCAICFVVLFSWRSIYSAYFVEVVGRDRILFIGFNPVIQEMAEHIQEAEYLGLTIAGFLHDEEEIGSELPGGKVLGRVADLHRVIEETKPNRIVLGLTERRNRMPVQELLDLRFAGYNIQEAGTTYEAVCGRICTKELRPSQLIFSGEFAPRPGSVSLQTGMNLTVSFIGAILTLPLMLLVAIAVRLTSQGPILYRQTRVGLNGRLFQVMKFRSMRVDAEKETGAVWASKNDTRVTPIGSFLRRTRLDELPQFFNVLRGDMSLVGPRPERPEFVQTLSEIIPYYRQRLSVKPGITGWAQINHRYGDTIEDTVIKLEYDLYYIKNISLSLDLYIIFQTLKTVILSRGGQ